MGAIMDDTMREEIRLFREEIREEIRELRQEVRALREAMYGNGKNGLVGRLIRVEDRVRMMLWAAMAAAGTGIGLIVNSFFHLITGGK